MTFRLFLLRLSRLLLLYALLSSAFATHACSAFAQLVTTSVTPADDSANGDVSRATRSQHTPSNSAHPSVPEKHSAPQAIASPSPSQQNGWERAPRPHLSHFSEAGLNTPPRENGTPVRGDDPDDSHAYIAFFKGEGFGTDEAAISVHINGVPATDILLHNSSMLSFRIPTEVLTDRQVFSSSYVEIKLASRRLAFLPLNVLKDAISRVNLAQWRLTAPEDLAHRSERFKPHPDAGPQTTVQQSGTETYQHLSSKIPSEPNSGSHVEDIPRINTKAYSGPQIYIDQSPPANIEDATKEDKVDSHSHTDEDESLNAEDNGGDMDMNVGANEELAEGNDKERDDEDFEEDKAEIREQTDGPDSIDETKGRDIDASTTTGTDTDAGEDTQLEQEAHVAELIQQAKSLLLSNDVQSNRHAVKLLEQAHEAQNTSATTTLASVYLSAPVGIHRDVKKAAIYLQKASEKGFPEAQALLGFLYASGYAAPYVPVHIGAALLLWTFASEGGSIIAKMALAYRYFTGTDVAEDCSRASVLYKEVADCVYTDFMKENAAHVQLTPRARGWDEDASTSDIRPPKGYNLPQPERRHLTEGGIHRVAGEAHEIVRYYQHSADRGDAHSQVVLGQLYYYGAADLPQNSERARALFKQAAGSGRAEAHAHLGYMDLREGKNESAVKHLEQAAEYGEKLGLHGMGYVSLRGIGRPKDTKQAVQYFQSAANKEYPEAMYNLAILHAKGVGVLTQSPEEAFKYYTKAAQYGHLQSSYKLGDMTLKGLIPTKKNCQGGTNYLKYVAEQGMWTTVLTRALRAYERGLYNDALYRYLLAAHAGLEVGQYNAAFMYEHGTVENEHGYGAKLLEHGKQIWANAFATEGKKRNEREFMVNQAMELYQMCASQQMRDAMVRLGDLAYGEAKDYRRAALAYEKAMNLWNAEATFNLGMMHARGFGMTPDKHMAKRYFDRAMETDRDARIPSMIALCILRYSDHMTQAWESLMSWFDGVYDRIARLTELGEGSFGDDAEVRASRMPSVSKAQPSSEEGLKHSGEREGRSLVSADAIFTPDVIAITILLGILVVVVNARQRRVMRLHRNAQQPDNEQHAEHVPPAPAPERAPANPETNHNDEPQVLEVRA